MKKNAYVCPLSKNKISQITFFAFLILAIVLWLFDALYQLLWFNPEGYSFWKILLGLNSPHILVLKLLMLFVLTISGIVIGQFTRQLIQQKEQSDKIANNIDITLKSIGDAVISTDVRGGITNMNPVAEKLTGWSFKEAKGYDIEQVFNIVNAKTGLKVENPVTKVLSDGKIVGLANHTKLISKQRKEYQISDSGAPIINSNGEISGVVLVFRDVTKDYKARQEIIESETKLRNIVENSTNLFYFHNVDHEIIYVSPQCKDYLSCSPEEAKRNWTDFATNNPINENGYKKTIKAIETGQKQASYELELKGLDGKVIWVEVNEAPVIENGKTVGIVGSLTDITKRKKIETKLLKSQERFNYAMEASQDGLFDWDLETNEIYYSPGWKKMLGYEYDELPNDLSVWEKLTNPADVKRSWKMQKAVMDGKRDRFLIEFKMKHKDGHWVDILSRAKAIFNDQGKAIRFVGTHVDISQRKKAEKTIRSQRERLGNIIEGTNAGTWEWNIQTGKTIFNERWAQIVGYSLEELSPGTINIWEKLVHPDDFSESQKLINKHISGALDYYHYECRMKHKDGYWVWVLDRGKVVKWTDDGDPLWMYGTHQDITKRKNSELALKESEARFKALHNASFGGIIIHDKGLILECNAGLSEITGYRYDELIGMDGLQLISDDTRNKVINNINQKYETPYEAIGVRKNGKRYPLRLEARQVPYKGKEVRVVEFRDITELKEAEKKRKKLENQLQQSQKMEAVGTLTGGIAHDFNNLLTPIMGYADMMRFKLPDNSPLQEYVDDILNSSIKAKDLIQQLLTFSQKQPNKLDPINIIPTIKGTLKFLKSSLPASITLKFNYDSEVGNIIANSTQIHQVIMNICINASHALKKEDGTEKGTIAIRLKQVEIDETDALQFVNLSPGQYAKLSITDNGKGMDEETLSHIFEPFYTTKEEGKGTGMGLAVVHGIIASYNGEIKVYSEIKKGTTFNIYFPVTSKNARPNESTEKVYSEEKKQKSLFVLDDRPYVTNMLEKMLQSYGYQVETSNNSKEALAHLKQSYSDYDILITDLTMPELSGLEIVKSLKADNISLPVILLTGHGQTIENYNLLGIQSIVHKPVLINELLKEINTINGND